MANIFDLRRENVRRLMKQWGGPTSLSLKLGHSNASYLAHLAGPHPSRDVSEKTAREIEKKLNLPEMWMDRHHKGDPDQPETGLLIDLVTTVKDVLDAEGVKVTKVKFTELVDLAYERSVEAGSIDTAYLRRLIKLLR